MSATIPESTVTPILRLTEVIPLSEADKIALTLAVVFGSLIIAALISITYWYFNVSKRSKKFRSRRSFSRSLEEIERDLRVLHKPPSEDSAIVGVDGDASNLPIDPNQVSLRSTDKTHQADTVTKEDHSSSSETHSSSMPTSDLVVIRCDKQLAGDGSISSVGPLVDTHIGATARKSRGADNFSVDEVAGSPIPDTRISTISSAYQDSTSHSQVYREMLWPDVIDPYHRSQQLELRIGDRAIDVYTCRTMTTVMNFHK